MSRNNRLNYKRLNIMIVSLVLVLTACSYTPNVTKVPTEKLASYNPKHFTSTKVKKYKVNNENRLIMQAIVYEQEGEYEKSNYYYNKLYEETGNEEYMFKEMSTALYIGKKSKNLYRLEEWIKEHPKSIKAKRLLLALYLNEKEYDKSKALAKILISQSGNPVDFELSANPYILTGEYAEAVKLLTQAYNKTFNEDILIKITTLLANYMGDVESAVNHLENHRHMHECSEKVCLQLLEIYTKQEKVGLLIEVYKDLYTKTKREQYAVKLVEGYIYTRELDKAIEFLKKEYQNDELLYKLYLGKKKYAKAQQIAETLYSKGNKPKWLAESAMALYENSPNKDDKVMLKLFIEKFEQALEGGARDSVYLNYYGYTLIDKDIDIEKGLMLIKEALEKEPDNSYYLDSLAWGYYKLNRCKEAYIQMKKVVDVEGLKEKEIIEHWTIIQQCQEKK